MTTSVALIVMALLGVGLIATLSALVWMAQRLKGIERMQAKSEREIAEGTGSTERRAGAANGPSAAPYPPPPLRLRTAPELAARRRVTSPQDPVAGELDRVFSGLNLPALLFLILLVGAFAFGMGLLYREARPTGGQAPATSVADGIGTTVPVGAGVPADEAAEGVRRVTLGDAALRADPSYQSPIVTIIPELAEVRMLGLIRGNWFEVLWEGKRGFVRGDLLVEPPAEGLRGE